MPMANTAITLTNEQGALVPSQPSVVVNSGDTVSFTTSDGSSAYLFFSPEAAAVLSPTPSSPIEASSTAAEFSFTSSSAGSYSVFFETSTDVTLPLFPVAQSNQLLLEIDLTNVKYGVVNTNTKG